MKSQRKGAAAERELVHELRRIGFTGAKKTSAMYQPGTVAPDISGLPGCHLEAKRVEKLNIEQAMDQSCMDAGPNIPVVCHRRSRSAWLLTLPLADVGDFAHRVVDALSVAASSDPWKEGNQ